MKKPFIALLLLLGVAAMAANLAFAGPEDQPELGNKLVNARLVKEMLSARAHTTRVNAGVDPDSVYVGHSWTDHTGYDGVNASSITNYWNIYTGVYFPTTSNANNALWDFDNTTGFDRYVGDSLAGWWPMRRTYSSTGSLTLTDDNRPWWALDHGNQVNYVMNAGPGGKRTKGVVGVWHSDPGRNAGKAVTWSPLSGSKSAWCGLREHGDNSVVDATTGQAFNQVAAEFSGETGSITTLASDGYSTGGTSKRFPGYGNQWDQILYRDLQPSAGATLNISFLYRTQLSKSYGTTASSRTGWFHGDPLAVTAGNFISSSAAGTSAPEDSFMVYIGAPVNDAACVYSDGVTRPVYDKQRRWFSEVIRIFEAGVPYYELFSCSGTNGGALDTTAAAATFSAAIPGTYVDNIRNASGNTNHIVRLVFRVKTNISYSDQDSKAGGFTSYGYGAAIIDDVTINSVNIGDFEGAEQSGLNSIDNRLGSSALNVWKSTGKPPAIYFHVRNLADLTYNDLCGPPDSPARQCNLLGVVLSAGNYDDGEKMGDSRWTSVREVMQGIVSPTINLTAGTGTNGMNNMGLTPTIVDATDDYYFWYDMYAGQFNLSFSGDAWSFAAQCYPARQTGNGAKCWGEVRVPSFILFNPEPQCFTDVEGLYGNGLMATSNTGYPDSLRLYIGTYQACFRFSVSLGCNSADGAYFDNMSLAFVDVPAATQVSSTNGYTLGSVTIDIWQFLNDAFPVNETAGLPGTAAFDTTTAVIKTGVNNAQATGNTLRFTIPGDSMVIKAANATVTAPTDASYKPVRVDMVFRILPGPGNYKAVAGRTYPPTAGMQLLQVPTNQSNVVSAGDASFWGQYIAAPGQFGTSGGHFGGTRWDNLTWNSARCDTLEANIFPFNTTGAAGNVGTGLTAGNYMNCYSELDPKFSTLGINKNVCFVVDTTKAASSTGSVNNISCSGTAPAYMSIIPQSRSGWNGSATTKEFTKIIPDGLLTPGSHVEYFFRKSLDIDPTATYAMCPDTNYVYPQSTEGSNDAHRWQEFSVLPDRWKDAAFGGLGMACLLYVDNADRRGAERVWVSVMDSLGGTRSADWGNHNGWHRDGSAYFVGTTNYLGSGAGADPTVAVYNKNKSAGTTWDMYGVKASESLTTSAGSFGARLGNRSSMGFATGMDSKVAPTPEMLRAYYRIVAVLTGDLTSGVWGPFANRSADDVSLMSDFLTSVGGTAQPRGILVNGDGFAQSETQTGGIVAAHSAFLSNKLGLTLRNGSYQAVSGNTNDCADLLTTSSITTNGDVYGVANSCSWSNDLYSRNPSIPEAVEASFYENVGPNGPYTASVKKPANGTRNWLALSEGFSQNHVFGRYCDADNGRLAYYYNMFNNVFGSLCSVVGSPTVTLDVPGNRHGGQFANFMKVGNSVMRAGNAKVHFGLANGDRVKIRMYDVTGRMVRTLADRSFAAGEYDLSWDGSDDSGNQVARGVYFARVEYAKKGVVGTGRVVVLR